MNHRLFVAGATRTLWRYRLRTVLISLGVILGVAVLVATRSVASGAKQEMLDRIDRMFSSSSLFITASSVMGARRGARLTLADVEAVANELGDAVVTWDPMQMMGGVEVRHEGQRRQLTVFGYSERAEQAWNRGVSRGRFFSAADVRTASRVALIGSRAAASLFGSEDPVGRDIRVGDAPFRVIGVLEEQGMDPHGMDRDDELQIPVTTLMRRLRNVDYILGAKLLVADASQAEATAEEVRQVLRRRHVVQAGEPDDFAVITPAQVQRMIGRADRVLGLFLPGAAGVALLVAAMVIASVMLLGVRERLAEIGLRKAMGATEGQIFGQFLVETCIVTLGSGVLGVLLGGFGARWASSFAKASAPLTGEAIFLGLAAAIGVGLVAGTLPARRAARLDPIVALR